MASKRPSPRQRAANKLKKQERLAQVEANMYVPLSEVKKKTEIRTNGLVLGTLKGRMHQVQIGQGMGRVVYANKTHKPFSAS